MRQTWEAASGSNISRYFYDASGNRVLSQQGIADQADIVSHTVETAYQGSRYRWINEGTLVAHYDLSGQPRRIGQREYVWDALGKLIEVREENHSLARYRYNHRGERIVKRIGQQGKQAVQYLYEDSKLVAEIDARGSIVRQYVYLGEQPIATIDTPEGKVVAQQGASQGKLVWHMRYGAFGQMQLAALTFGKQASVGRFELKLRLPGQYEDGETGLYYNGQRYYDPQRGRYLTPDPLGTPDGPNPYTYVRNNPLKYVDPRGLILFAFDGTENTDDQAWLAAHDSSLSNVVAFRNLYNDGDKHYITGVGTVDKSDPVRPIEAPLLDAGVTWSGAERITRMVEYFNDEADLASDDNAPMDADIIGFSRGAAQARDFANQIVANTKNGWYSYKDKNGKDACQKVNFRCMGLWDTVLSNNWSGHSYNFGIPAQFSYVAQAVALNECRGHTLPLGRANVLDPHSWGAFPLESIMGDAVPATQTRIEKGFIGAHADIGGGFGKDESQLSQVALAWMIARAKAAGVPLSNVSITVPANPVLHDKSDAIRFGLPMAGTQLTNDGTWNEDYTIPGTAIEGTGAEDRTVRYLNGTMTTQRQVTGTGMTNADTEQFITYDPTRSRPDNITGTVDMNAYRAWLLLNGYDLGNLTVH